MNTDYGARIERGVIAESDENGYRVLSYSRDGIYTPCIPSSVECAEGDWVYFFVFPDGHGMIIGKFETK
jgi:hypothetical protein